MDFTNPRQPTPHPPSTPPSKYISQHPPITPSSRPPSSGSVRYGTPRGHLTLHEYRKQQNTPSPTSVNTSARRLKRKAASSNLAFHQPPPERDDERPRFSAHTLGRIQQLSNPLHSPFSPPLLAVSPATISLDDVPSENLNQIPQTKNQQYQLSEDIADLLHPGFLPHMPSSPGSTNNLSIGSPAASSDISFSRFPHPPTSIPVLRDERYHYSRSPLTATSSPYQHSTTSDAPSTIIHHRGTSFDLINPHASLELLRIRESTGEEYPTPTTPGRESINFSSRTPITMAFPAERSTEGVTEGATEGVAETITKPRTPPKALYDDLPTAYEYITTGRSASGERPKRRSLSSPELYQPSGLGLDLSLPLKPSLRAITDRSLPPTPVTANSDSPKIPNAEQQYVEIPLPPISVETKPPTSQSWREKFTSLFTRKQSVSSINSQVRAPMEDSTMPNQQSYNSLYPAPLQIAVSHTPPFRRASKATSHAASLNVAASPDKANHLSSSPPRISQHYYDHSSIYDAVIGEYSGSANTGRNLLPSTSYGSFGQAPDTNINSSDIPRTSTLGSIVRQYGDSSVNQHDSEDVHFDERVEDEIEYGSQGRPKVIRVVSGLSKFDFGLSRENSAGASSDASDGQHGSSHHRQFSGAPPSIPLPPIPPQHSQMRRENSATTGGLSTTSSYGDTRNLLHLTQNIPPINIGQLQGNDSTESAATPQSGKASSGVLGEASLRDSSSDNHNRSSRLLPRKHRFYDGRSESGHSQRISMLSMEHKPSTGSVSRDASRSLSIGHHGLERDISRELRRISALSGGQSLNGSLIIVDENGPDADLIHEELAISGSHEDVEHGGFQSSSTHEGLIREPSFGHQRDINSGSQPAGLPSLWTGRARGSITGKGSFDTSLSSELSTSDSDAENELFKELGEDTGDQRDWETVGGSQALSKFGTGTGTFPNRDSGSSIADFSTQGDLSLNSKTRSRRHSPLRFGESIIQHPADERFEHVYRVRQVTPDSTPMLLPSYTFVNDPGIGHRNAMASMLPAGYHTYQHPSPLTKDHINPFNSSPPFVMTSHQNLPSITLQTRNENKTFQSENEVRDRGGKASSFGSMGSLGNNLSYGSMDWVTTHGGQEGSLNGDDLPTGGSFSKIAMLGPKGNITGTPDGTGMREVGSSPADDSIRGAQFSSPFVKDQNSPSQYRSPYAIPSTPASSPLQGALPSSSTHSKNPSRSRPGVLYDMIREHRLEEGYLPSTSPRMYQSQVNANTLFKPPLLSPISGLDGFDNDKQSQTPSQDNDIYPRPVSFNRTPPLPPLPLMPSSDPLSSEKHSVFSMPRLRRPWREDSSVGIPTVKRKQLISRVVLALCILFPPMLLLYGYGLLDGVMVSLSKGDINHFGTLEKKIGRWAGWTLAAGAIIGIVIGMIVVGVR